MKKYIFLFALSASAALVCAPSGFAYSNVDQETDYIELNGAAKLLAALIIIAIIAGGLLPQNFLRLARDGLMAIMP